MRFTIAIPTYNNCKTIEKAINSALSQDYKGEYEVLIVNNASTDSTAEVLSKFDNPILRIITNEETVDLFSNHNVCFLNAKGDYVVFCHADDTLLPNALSILDEQLKEEAYPEKIIVWGRSLFRDYYSTFEKVGYRIGDTISGERALIGLAGSGGLTPSGTCYSRRGTIELGLFPTMNNRVTPLDWYILVVAAFNGFEFKMVDRLLFIRKAASTAVSGIQQPILKDAYKYAFKCILEKLDDNDKQRWINLIYTYGLPTSYHYLKNHIPSNRKLKLYLRSIKKTGTLRYFLNRCKFLY